MTRELCSCGHGIAVHGLGRERCKDCACRDFRPSRRAHRLTGVYDLGTARRALRARTGKPLLDPKPRG